MTAKHGEAAWAHGSNGGRWRWSGAGIVTLAAAVGLWWIAGSHSIVQSAALLLIAASLMSFLVAFWRRERSFRINGQGIEFRDGGDAFGERQLVPWSSVTWFGTVPVRGKPDEVRLAIEWHGLRNRIVLPGSRRPVEEAAALARRVAQIAPHVAR